MGRRRTSPAIVVAEWIAAASYDADRGLMPMSPADVPSTVQADYAASYRSAGLGWRPNPFRDQKRPR